MVRPGQLYVRLSGHQDMWADADPHKRGCLYQFRGGDVMFVVQVFPYHRQATAPVSQMLLVVGGGQLGWLDFWPKWWRQL